MGDTHRDNTPLPRTVLTPLSSPQPDTPLPVLLGLRLEGLVPATLLPLLLTMVGVGLGGGHSPPAPPDTPPSPPDPLPGAPHPALHGLSLALARRCQGGFR